MLNKLSVSQLAELGKLSKAYISQVKHGKRPPSERLLESLRHLQRQRTKTGKDYLALFLQSRQANEVSSGTLRFYRVKLGKFLTEVDADKAFGLLNPMRYIKAPRLGKLITPSLTQEQVYTLLERAHNERDKAIIALFTESGLRLSELTNIEPEDIDWESDTVRVIGKGKKEAFAPSGNGLKGISKLGWLGMSLMAISGE